MTDLYSTFVHAVNDLPTIRNLRMLELGTSRWGTKPTHHKAQYPLVKEYIMSDIRPGLDVDVVADIYNLREPFGFRAFDVILCMSVFEHLEYPWKAADEIIYALKPGGLFFIHSHHTFPVHGYPYDYFRYTDRGLASLFKDAVNVQTSLEFPCKIISGQIGEVAGIGYLNVLLMGNKP